MKKVILALILIVILAAALILAFIRIDGGKYVKKAATEAFEVGEDLEELTDKMVEKEEEVKKQVKEDIDDVKQALD